MPGSGANLDFDSGGFFFWRKHSRRTPAKWAAGTASGGLLIVAGAELNVLYVY